MRIPPREATRKTFSRATAAALLTALAACGGSGFGGGLDRGADETAAAASQERVDAALKPQTSIEFDTPLDAPPEKGKLAYLIRYNLQGTNPLESWPEIVSQVGWKGRVLAIDAADPLAGNNAIKQAVAAGADYIAVHGNNLDVIQEGMDVAKAEGVPVFFTNGVGDVEREANGLYGNVAGLEGVVAFSSAILDWAIADGDGATSVLWVNYPDAQILALQEPLTRATFEENCPKCVYANFDLSADQLSGGGSVDAIVAEIRKKPDIGYVATGMSATATGLRQALDAAGLNDVKIAVAGLLDGQFQAVADGEIDVAARFGIQEALFAVLDQILRYDQGMDVLQDEHAIRPYQLFSTETVGDTKTWDGPDGFEDQYLKLWGVK